MGFKITSCAVLQQLGIGSGLQNTPITIVPICQLYDTKMQDQRHTNIKSQARASRMRSLVILQ